MIKNRNARTWRRILDGVLTVATLAALGWTGMGRAAAQAQAGAQAKALAKKAANPDTKKVEKPAPAKSGVRPVEGGLRDPFRLPAPITEEPQGDKAVLLGPLPPGSRGLIIDQLKLEGIVRQNNGNKMIAVLANSANRAYFLHENDPLYDGVITKITSDSVYFKEDVHDAAGKTSSREVIKKLGPASGEKK